MHLALINPDNGPMQARFFGEDVDGAARWASEHNDQKWNVYYTANVAPPGFNRKPAKRDIVAVRFAHVDVDPPKDGSPWDIDATLKRLDAALPVPNIIVRSGNGVQALWRVEKATIAEIEQINRALIARFGGDVGTYNADRLLRVPGTVNYPDQKKRAIGRVAALAASVRNDRNEDVPYGIEVLRAAFGASLPANDSDEKPLPLIENFELITSNDLALPPRDGLRELIDDPRRTDRSADTYALALEMLRRGLAPEQVMGVLLNQQNAVSAHCLDQRDPNRAARRAIANAGQALERRAAQRALDRQIGAGTGAVPTTTTYTLEDMLDRHVFVKDGSQVADLCAPQLVQSLADFRNTTAASKHRVRWPDGREKLVPCSKAWLEHPERKEVDTVTFHAGAPAITTAPQGDLSALNTWRPRERGEAPVDWEERATVFVEHVEWLWGESAGEFLDFLAHAEQKPGVLPHYGWIHVSRVHGKGRNWISGLLARLWPGNVATSLDLMAVLEDGFNARLSRCLLAVVDEINEGGSQSYRHAQALRQLVTAEVREINPKYGRRHIEYNSARWLFFSNHTGVIPLGEEDRRFYVVEHEGPVREPQYYERLYCSLADPLFVRSVAEILQRRDISGFKPGKHPPMTAAKDALIAFSRTDEDEMFRDLAARWPTEVISGREIRELFEDDVLRRPSSKHAMDRAGIRKLKKTRLSTGVEMVYALCDHEYWAKRPAELIRQEIDSMSLARKLAHMRFEAPLPGCRL